MHPKKKKLSSPSKDCQANSVDLHTEVTSQDQECSDGHLDASLFRRELEALFHKRFKQQEDYLNNMFLKVSSSIKLISMKLRKAKNS